MELSHRISEARKKAGLTLWELSEAVHVDTATVSAWEAGTIMPDEHELARLCQALHISVENLLYEKASKPLTFEKETKPLTFWKTVFAGMIAIFLMMLVARFLALFGIYIW